jgi:hypothetical protein
MVMVMVVVAVVQTGADAAPFYQRCDPRAGTWLFASDRLRSADAELAANASPIACAPSAPMRLLLSES